MADWLSILEFNTCESSRSASTSADFLTAVLWLFIWMSIALLDATARSLELPLLPDIG